VKYSIEQVNQISDQILGFMLKTSVMTFGFVTLNGVIASATFANDCNPTRSAINQTGLAFYQVSISPECDPSQLVNPLTNSAPNSAQLDPVWQVSVAIASDFTAVILAEATDPSLPIGSARDTSDDLDTDTSFRIHTNPDPAISAQARSSGKAPKIVEDTSFRIHTDPDPTQITAQTKSTQIINPLSTDNLKFLLVSKDQVKSEQSVDRHSLFSLIGLAPKLGLEANIETNTEFTQANDRNLVAANPLGFGDRQNVNFSGRSTNDVRSINRYAASSDYYWRDLTRFVPERLRNSDLNWGDFESEQIVQ